MYPHRSRCPVPLLVSDLLSCSSCSVTMVPSLTKQNGAAHAFIYSTHLAIPLLVAMWQTKHDEECFGPRVCIECRMSAVYPHRSRRSVLFVVCIGLLSCCSVAMVPNLSKMAPHMHSFTRHILLYPHLLPCRKQCIANASPTGPALSAAHVPRLRGWVKTGCGGGSRLFGI